MIDLTFVFDEYVFENWDDYPGYRAKDSRCSINDNTNLLTTRRTIKSIFTLFVIKVKISRMLAY